MLCRYKITGIVINIILLLILIDPILAERRYSGKGSREKDRIRLLQQEERQVEFGKGRSKQNYQHKQQISLSVLWVKDFHVFLSKTSLFSDIKQQILMQFYLNTQNDKENVLIYSYCCCCNVSFYMLKK